MYSLVFPILFFHCTVLDRKPAGKLSRPAPLHYTTTLYYTTLHYTTLPPYTTIHYTTLLYTTLHYTTLHYTTLHYTTLHYTTLHYTTRDDRTRTRCRRNWSVSLLFRIRPPLVCRVLPSLGPKVFIPACFQVRLVTTPSVAV